MKKRTKEKSVAVFTVFEASLMTEKGRKDIADWLRHCAKTLVKEGTNYAKRFTARYMYIPKSKKRK